MNTLRAFGEVTTGGWQKENKEVQNVLNVREEKKQHSHAFKEFKYSSWILMKIKQTHKGIGPFFYGIKGMVYVQINVQRGAVNFAFFELPFRCLCCYLLPCNILCHLLVMQELSFHRFLCGSSASCQLCSSRSFRAPEGASRASGQANSALEWNRQVDDSFQTGGWTAVDGGLFCYQIKVHSVISGFPKQLSETPWPDWPWLSVCITGAATTSAKHSLPCFWTICTSSSGAVDKI